MRSVDLICLTREHGELQYNQYRLLDHSEPHISASVSREPRLFGNTNRAISQAHFSDRAARQSLVLVQPRVLFELADVSYDLLLTDPAFAGPLQRREESEYRSAGLGLLENAPILFTISLGEPF